ncbi:hypothetical protein QBC38DRAFT_519500, partial [Podospora fimiseda]
MEVFIRNQLSELEGETLNDSVFTITKKANGIFLWVALAVKSIRSRLEDGYGLSDIIRDIDSMPDELEELFQYLLKKIPKPYKIKAYITFAMLKLSNEVSYGLTLNLLAYSFLDGYLEDPKFAEKRFHWPHLTASQQSDLKLSAHKKLRSHCGGLVEA